MIIAAITKSGKESLNIDELEGIMGTSYQNVKKMAVILEKQGFLALQKNPSDARAILISLTEQCKEYFLQQEHIEKDFLLSIFSGIDEKKTYSTKRLLKNNATAFIIEPKGNITDCSKLGKLILGLHKEKNTTQKELQTK